MNYLISTFDCVVFDGELYEMKANVKYKMVEKCKNCGIVFSNNNASHFILNFETSTKNILKVEDNNDCYFFLFEEKVNAFFNTKFNYKTNEVIITLSSKLIITIDGLLICEENVENLKYSHYEIISDLCVIYFEGKRNYVVILKDKELYAASYYDEYNESENEKYFMACLKDFLNHGKVIHLKDGKYEEYLVYLDEEELNLKSEFVPFVFLDCVKAKNLAYANELFSENLKMKDVKEIEKFFPEFDFYYPLNKNKFMLANKNTLAGIYEFVIENNLITNLLCLD